MYTFGSSYLTWKNDVFQFYASCQPLRISQRKGGLWSRWQQLETVQMYKNICIHSFNNVFSLLIQNIPLTPIYLCTHRHAPTHKAHQSHSYPKIPLPLKRIRNSLELKRGRLGYPERLLGLKCHLTSFHFVCSTYETAGHVGSYNQPLQ